MFLEGDGLLLPPLAGEGDDPLAFDGLGFDFDNDINLLKFSPSSVSDPITMDDTLLDDELDDDDMEEDTERPNGKTTTTTTTTKAKTTTNRAIKAEKDISKANAKKRKLSTEPESNLIAAVTAETLQLMNIDPNSKEGKKTKRQIRNRMSELLWHYYALLSSLLFSSLI